MEQIIFSAKNVNGNKGKFTLKNIDFELPCGYIMGVVGKNGAGKTTFFRYIMDEKKKYNGSFFLGGRDISEDHVWLMNHVGFVSEDNTYFMRRTAFQNVDLLKDFYSEFDMELFLNVMKLSKLDAAKTVGCMSRGEYMKFQLAFAIAYKPELLLLDEPTAGMDPVYRKDFYKLLKEILEQHHCSVIMSSHIEEDIDKQFDYIGLFEDGNFVSFKENELK
ncbi:MAG: ATP-binding cassette domain-containing protein [Lachnospira sp.]